MHARVNSRTPRCSIATCLSRDVWQLLHALPSTDAPAPSFQTLTQSQPDSGLTEGQLLYPSARLETEQNTTQRPFIIRKAKAHLFLVRLWFYPFWFKKGGFYKHAQWLTPGGGAIHLKDQLRRGKPTLGQLGHSTGIVWNWWSVLIATMSMSLSVWAH